MGLKLACSGCGCGAAFNIRSVSCDACGGHLTFSYDYGELKDKICREGFKRYERGVWGYSDLLPHVNEQSVVSLGEGGTFLHQSLRLAELLRLPNLFIKDETRNPTGSFLDRGSTVFVSATLGYGVKHITCSTTGNLGASVAAYAAKAGLECTIFIQGIVDLGKLYQMMACGARVFVSPTEREQASERLLEDESVELSPTNPFFLEGEKTTVFETFEQMGFALPDRVVLPVGNGGHLAMIWKGLVELEMLGLISDSKPKLTGVQAERGAAIVQAYLRDEEVQQAKRGGGFPSDITVEAPLMGREALRAIRDSRGLAVTVTDKEIMESTGLLAKTEGLFAEPAAASTVAGIRKLAESGQLDKDERIVCVITGTGLKDPLTARRMVSASRRLEGMVRWVEDRRLTTSVRGTKLKILQIVSKREAYGYDIWKLVKERFGVRITVPSIYQHISELESVGLVKRTSISRAKGRPERRYYSITERGRRLLQGLEEFAG